MASRKIAPPSDETRTLRVTCAWGLPPYLAREIEALGLKVTATDPTGVETEGTGR